MADEAGVIRLPALVGGRLVFAPARSADRLRDVARTGGRDADGVIVVSRPILDRQTLTPTGEDQLLVFPSPEACLSEAIPSDRAVRELLDLPFEEVCAYVTELGRRLQPGDDTVGQAMEAAARTSPLGGRAMRVFAAQLAGLLDPDALGEAVDRELAFGGVPGRSFLDGWVDLQRPGIRGASARMSDRIFGGSTSDVGPRLRAIPTRQLHITAGNSPIVSVVSMLWAMATKGATVIKPAEGSPFATSLLAAAMVDADGGHPLTRHTSLLYWRGGDARVEDVLLSDGVFDRWIGWGSASTIAAIARRAGGTKTVFMGPRIAVSLIGRDALAADAHGVAVRAAADSLVANQAACNASLVHYVEGSEATVLAYCEELRDVLGAWDRELPQAIPRESAVRLRRLQRGAFAHGTWFENGQWPYLTSVVVYLPTGIDLDYHPAGRCVLVRRVDALADALTTLNPRVAAVGVSPETARTALQDQIVGRGVDNVLPLGDAERAYPGMPHDGIRVLSELVRWVSA
jgi:hypothetical protein